MIAENLRKAKAAVNAKKAEETAMDVEYTDAIQAEAIKIAESVLEDISPSANTALNVAMDAVEEENKGEKRMMDWNEEMEGLGEGLAKEPRISPADLASELLFPSQSGVVVSRFCPSPRKALFEEQAGIVGSSAAVSLVVGSVAEAAASNIKKTKKASGSLYLSCKVGSQAL